MKPALMLTSGILKKKGNEWPRGNNSVQTKTRILLILPGKSSVGKMHTDLLHPHENQKYFNTCNERTVNQDFNVLKE